MENIPIGNNLSTSNIDGQRSGVVVLDNTFRDRQKRTLSSTDFHRLIDKYRSEPDLLAMVLDMMTPEEFEQYARSLVDKECDSERDQCDVPERIPGPKGPNGNWEKGRFSLGQRLRQVREDAL